MRSAALKSRRLRSVTSERATRQLLLCYHRNPPPLSPIKVQRVAGWGWTAPRRSKHLWGTVLSNHTARRKAETRMLTFPLCPAQVSAGRGTGWCIALITASVADAAELTGTSRRSEIPGNERTQLLYIDHERKHNLYRKKINSDDTVSSGHVNVCACGSLYTQIIYHDSSQEHPAAQSWLVGLSCVSSGNEHSWSPKLDAKELLMEDKR